MGEDEERTLGSFGLQDGWEVLVDEFDAEARRAAAEQAAAAARAEAEARAAVQLKAGDVLKSEFAKTFQL